MPFHITDTEYALALQNRRNVEAANRTIDSLEADIRILRNQVEQLRGKLAQSYFDFAVSHAHAGALDAQVKALVGQVSGSCGLLAFSGSRFVETGKPASKLSVLYNREFDRLIAAADMDLNPLDFRAVLDTEVPSRRLAGSQTHH